MQQEQEIEVEEELDRFLNRHDAGPASTSAQAAAPAEQQQEDAQAAEPAEESLFLVHKVCNASYVIFRAWRADLGAPVLSRLFASLGLDQRTLQVSNKDTLAGIAIKYNVSVRLVPASCLATSVHGSPQPLQATKVSSCSHRLRTSREQMDCFQTPPCMDGIPSRSPPSLFPSGAQTGRVQRLHV